MNFRGKTCFISHIIPLASSFFYSFFYHFLLSPVFCLLLFLTSYSFGSPFRVTCKAPHACNSSFRFVSDLSVYGKVSPLYIFYINLFDCEDVAPKPQCSICIVLRFDKHVSEVSSCCFHLFLNKLKS